jgi:putative transposase
MTRPLSNDLRERVMAAVLAGESCRSVAARFGVAVSSVVKWSQRYRATGSVAPGRMGGHRKRVLEPYRAFIAERVRETPHLTLHGLKDELAARGVTVSHNAVWLFLRREGLSFKKKRCLPLSRPAPTLRGGGSVGGPGNRGSTLKASSSLTRPGLKRTWRHCGAGDREANACAASLLTATGAP